MTGPLPAFLSGISLLVAENAVADSPLALRIRRRLKEVPFLVVEDGTRLEQNQGDTLFLRRYQGRFLRPCPGTRRYQCCGYRILHIGENCPLGCSYCILQAYFQDRVLKVWANQEELFVELEEVLSRDSNRLHRLGTGEFTDSLVLESVTGFSADLIRRLIPFNNVRLELKTKTADLTWLEAVSRPEQILPAWSLNAPQVTAREEGQAARLEERLAAAGKCVKAGMRVCFHFDPIIRYPGWREGYAEIVDRLAETVSPRDIAYISLGSFRFLPELKACIEARHPQATYIHEEYIRGLDGKQRLLRPLRVEQLRFVARRLASRGFDEQLYLCMESDDVWRAALGRTPAEQGGLGNFLMHRAFGSQ